MRASEPSLRSCPRRRSGSTQTADSRPGVRRRHSPRSGTLLRPRGKSGLSSESNPAGRQCTGGAAHFFAVPSSGRPRHLWRCARPSAGLNHSMQNAGLCARVLSLSPQGKSPEQHPSCLPGIACDSLSCAEPGAMPACCKKPPSKSSQHQMACPFPALSHRSYWIIQLKQSVMK